MTSKLKGGSARYLLAAGAALIALGVSSGAEAYNAYITTPAPLLSGPAPDYPPVLDFRGGEPVTVYGCLEDFGWCDVSFENYRGWFDGNSLAYGYQGQWVPLFDNGYRIGVPVIGFSFDDYWGRYYRDRPFFRERERWARIPPPELRHHDEGFRGDGRPGFGPEGPRPGYDRGPGFDRGPGPDPRPGFDRGLEGQRPPQFQPQPQNRQAPPQQPQAQQRPPQPQPGQQQRPPNAGGQPPGAPRPPQTPPPAPHPAAAPPPAKPPAGAPHPEEPPH